MPYNDPIYWVFGTMVGIGLLVALFLFVTRAWDVVSSATRFGQTASQQARSVRSHELRHMSRKDRFYSLPTLPRLPLEFTLQQHYHDAETEPTEVLDRFEQLLIDRAPKQASFAIRQGTDPRWQSIVVIFEPSQAVKLFGWLEFSPSNRGFSWSLMASETRLFKSPIFEDSHFSQQTLSAAETGDAFFDVAAAATTVAFSGYKTRHGSEAAEHLKNLLLSCLAVAITPSSSPRPSTSTTSSANPAPRVKKRRE